jgi:GT2 family glycosyltransferase
MHTFENISINNILTREINIKDDAKIESIHNLEVISIHDIYFISESSFIPESKDAYIDIKSDKPFRFVKIAFHFLTPNPFNSLDFHGYASQSGSFLSPVFKAYAGMDLKIKYFDFGSDIDLIRINVKGAGYLFQIRNLCISPINRKIYFYSKYLYNFNLFLLKTFRVFKIISGIFKFLWSHRKSIGVKYSIFLIRKLYTGIKEYGIFKLLLKVRSYFSTLIVRASAVNFFKRQVYSLEEFKKRIEKLHIKPLISILMPVYNVHPNWLLRAIESVKKQIYPNWELCIVDDGSTNSKTLEYLKNIFDHRIKIKFLNMNSGISIASNYSAGEASGEYFGLMDHDDELSCDALYFMVKWINETGADFLYSDEAIIDSKNRIVELHCKPDYSPDMLLSQNYFNHFVLIKRELFEEVGGFRTGYEGSQDHDLFLRVIEKTNKIVHVPEVLYYWRRIKGSASWDFSWKHYAWEAGKKAVEDALERRGIDGIVQFSQFPGTYRVKRKMKEHPLVSIIIPFKDKHEITYKCIHSILNYTDYKNYEVICLSNNSQEHQTYEMMESLSKYSDKVRFFECNIPFNFSKINNIAVNQYAMGKHVVLMNNDIELFDSIWLEALLEHSEREEVGAVGGLLLYPDGRVQHAGIIIGINGAAGHSHRGHPVERGGYFARPHIIQNVSAVTGAFLMVKRNLYLKIGGLNERELKVAFNDVDFCLRMREEGFLNVYTPYARAIHHESTSRGYEESEENIKRYMYELRYLRDRHQKIFKEGDPYYNQNLTLMNELFGYNY